MPNLPAGPVSSSNVSVVGPYSEKTGELEVSFKGGQTYSYTVPYSVAQGMVQAGSKGRYVHEVLNGYPYRRIA